MDQVDNIRAMLAEVYPDLDTSTFGITGRVLRLARVVEARRAAHLESFDLTPGEFDVLAALRRIDDGQGVNPRQLLLSLLITSGGLTKRLDRLETKGLLERHPDPSDRRGTLVRLSSDGATLVDEALPSLLAMEAEEIGSQLSAKQIEQTDALLRMLSR